MKYCTKCGYTNSDDAKFCVNCGEILQTVESAASTDSAQDITEPCTITTSVEVFGEDIVGHGPPFSEEEYKAIRFAETQQQCERLKKYYNFNSFDAQLTCAQIYEFWGAKYRLLAIYHYQKCAQLLDPSNPQAHNIFSSLGNLYEKCHEFALAIEAYQNAIRLQPQQPSDYAKIAECLKKMNRISDAIIYLENLKTSQYYISPAQDSNFDRYIDLRLQDLYKKKASGYKFKPKKEKFEYLDYSSTIDDICAMYLKTWE